MAISTLVVPTCQSQHHTNVMQGSTIWCMSSPGMAVLKAIWSMRVGSKGF